MKIAIRLSSFPLLVGLGLSGPQAPPDLTVLAIEVRDATRLSLVSPTAGNSLAVTVTVENRARDASPDVSLLCSRMASLRGRAQAQASVRRAP